MAADWSQLPKDILQLVSEKLNSQFYQLRLRSVCSSWRSSVPKYHHQRLRLLTTPSNNNNNHTTFISNPARLLTRSIFLITPPPTQPTLRPWLIKIGPDMHNRYHLWHPLSRDKQLPFHFRHVIDFNKLRVFNLGTELFSNFPCQSRLSLDYNKKVRVEKLVLFDYDTWCNSEEKDGGVILLFVHNSGRLDIARLKLCDDRWTTMPVMTSYLDVSYDDVCVFDGRPIAVDSSGRTVVVGLDLSLELVAEPVFGGNKKFLVESDGELLLVDKYLASVSHDGFLDDYQNGGGDHEIRFGRKRAVRFDVFRLNKKEKKWVEVKSLGDRVLFLGEGCAFSASASELCMETGNCVIFRDEGFRHVHFTGLGVRVFCLDKRQISPLFDFPHYSKLFWPPPEWILGW